MRSTPPYGQRYQQLYEDVWMVPGSPAILPDDSAHTTRMADTATVVCLALP